MPLIALKNEHSRFLLLTSLILYLVARILQLFGGEVPSLLMVIFHVIPPGLGYAYTMSGNKAETQNVLLCLKHP
jgi:hypothetical protein